MTLTFSARRTAASVLGSGIGLGVLLGFAAPAVAGPGPGCTAGDITAVEAQVATAMTGYLFTHPEVNDLFTSVDALPRPEARNKIASYLAANPQTKAEIDAIRGPAFALRDRCDIPDDLGHFGVL
ncbi:MAG: heme-binding protein [Mycobacterium sp.]|nr:heme-binding protein [Mycobacterium sp.]